MKGTNSEQGKHEGNRGKGNTKTQQDLKGSDNECGTTQHERD
jgi:hypothetical protein